MLCMKNCLPLNRKRRNNKIIIWEEVLLMEKLYLLIHWQTTLPVLIDQMVKIVISKVFMKYEFDIIAKVLRFNPELNTRLSYAGNFFELLSSPFVTILLNVFVLFLFLSGYMLYQAKRAHTSFWVKMIMICGISGCLCSLIDKVFWGGSLDFLQIPTLFIFDLKDCYLTVAEVIFVVIGILNSKEISVKEYLHFCCNKFSL